MPEGPELRLSALFVTSAGSSHRFGGPVRRSAVAAKNPEVSFAAERYHIWAESRGKELKVHLRDLDREENRCHIRFRDGKVARSRGNIALILQIVILGLARLKA